MYLRKKRNWENPEHTENWWINILQNQMLPEEWLMMFRMPSKDFFNIEEQIRTHIKQRQNSFMGDLISSCKKLAMTLYYLKDQGSLRMTSNATGVGLSTVSNSICQVCHAIVTVLETRLIEFSAIAESLKELIQRFEHNFGFPMVLGCFGGTHIPT